MRAIERRGLPANEEAERFVLGSVLLDGNRFSELALSVELEDFSSETNRRIWAAMCELSGRGVSVDRVTLADELHRLGQLESVGGLSYIVSLDDGLPHLANLVDYCNILREKKILRDVIYMARSIEESAASGQDSSGLLGRAEVMVRALGLQTVRSSAFLSPREIIQAAGNLDGYLSQDRALGIPTGFSVLDGMTGGLKPGELWVIAAETGGGKSTFASHITQNMTRAGFPTATENEGMSLVTTDPAPTWQRFPMVTPATTTEVAIIATASAEEAFLNERRIKGWNRAKKEALISADWTELVSGCYPKPSLQHGRPSCP